MLKINQTAYIYGTYKGIAITPLAPPPTQRHIIVRGDGTVMDSINGAVQT